MDASRKRHLLVMLALCLITLLAYSNSFTAGFTLDNKNIFLRDTRIREATWENVELILRHHYWWPNSQSGLYRPFTLLTYLFDYAVLGYGENPAGYHWVNFLLHAINVLLVYALARRLIREFWPPVFVAALWSVHPVLTESVTNLVGRADLLAGMAVLGGLLMYLKSAEAAGSRRWAWLAGLALAATLGVFSKESAATLPGVMVLYEVTFWQGRQRAKPMMLGCAAVSLALAAMWYQRTAVFRNLPPPDFPFYNNPLVGAGFWTAKLTAIKVMGQYLGLLAWPARLSCDHSYAQIPLVTGSPRDWMAWIAVAAVAAAAAMMWRFNRVVFFVAGMALVTFLPSSNLFFPMGTIMAERFLYLPCMALATCVVLALYAAGRRFGSPRLAPVALCLIAAALALRTWVRNRDWQDQLSLATATVEASPNSFVAHDLLAEALFDSDPSRANIDRVIKEAETSVAILATLPDARSYPEVYLRAGSYCLGQQTLPAFRRSLELLLRGRDIAKVCDDEFAAAEGARGRVISGAFNSRMADFERAISTAHLRLADPAKAIQAARQAQRLAPLDARIYLQLAGSLQAGDRAEEAAITLVEGVLLTGDAALRQELVGLYQRGLDKTGCATRGAALDPSCPLVHQHLCAGSTEAIAVNLRIERPDLAEQLSVSARRDFGCSKK